jgi:hypothetical protein
MLLLIIFIFFKMIDVIGMILYVKSVGFKEALTTEESHLKISA